ncbi:type II toxin-antitoxin system PemK/MazF family toxin [endosymbiont GvMRE of Glomus versiforme]|uniref:type II toxin-antitoxin system PemK/MazF family toxin n=1 Tax=endosymbiont GvMRE of Glomus versiforme TaxID=2039283 RepID=UPI000EC21938|nr:type II toxin-antitoxin system PemK/MazF family toxin [endosymbiont GvMRE of Glomus versiforme]RHZ35910.1 mRNA interferase [endosymbiont GvMRE of Glomus versiforme]
MVKRGEVYRVRLDDAEGHEQKGDKETGYRPVVIVSNNQQNAAGKIFVVVPLTSKIKKLYQAFQVPIFFRGKQGRAKCEQVRVIDVGRLEKYRGKLTEREMTAINEKLVFVLDLLETFSNEQVLALLKRRLQKGKISWLGVLTSLEVEK